MSVYGTPGLPHCVVGESLARLPWPWSRGASYTSQENLSCCALMYKIDSGTNTCKKNPSPTMLLKFKTQNVCLLHQKGKWCWCVQLTRWDRKGLAKGRTCPRLPGAVCASYKFFLQHIFCQNLIFFYKWLKHWCDKLQYIFLEMFSPLSHPIKGFCPRWVMVEYPEIACVTNSCF